MAVSEEQCGMQVFMHILDAQEAEEMIWSPSHIPWSFYCEGDCLGKVIK